MSKLFKFYTSIAIVLGATWNYDDPSTWSVEFPDCNAGGESPIDIKISKVKHDESVCNSGLSWHIHPQKNGTYRVINNGHSINVKPVSKSTSSGGHRRLLATGPTADGYHTLSTNETTIATFDNAFGSVKGINSKFCLDGFHFHWGDDRYHVKGSEHLVNNYSFPLELHFVHYSCDFSNINEALAYANSDNPKDKYTLGVIGVFFNISQTPNRALEKILSNKVLVNVATPSGVDGNVTGSTIISDMDIFDLLPKKLDFWAYDGSLTTPPCYPIVRWHVLKNQIHVGYRQLDRLLNFLGKNGTLSDNFRPVQDNPNPVYDCSGSAHHATDHVGDHSSSHEEEKSLKDNGLAVFGITAGVIFVCFLILGCVYLKDYVVDRIRNGGEADMHKQTIKSFSHANDSFHDMSNNRGRNNGEANHLNH